MLERELSEGTLAAEAPNFDGTRTMGAEKAGEFLSRTQIITIICTTENVTQLPPSLTFRAIISISPN